MYEHGDDGVSRLFGQTVSYQTAPTLSPPGDSLLCP